MSDTVLLTGATGFLGMELLARLLQDSSCEVIALVRAHDRKSAEARLARVFSTLYEDVPEAVGRVQALPADVSADGLGLSVADRSEILARATSVVHCAASIAFDLPLEQACSVNAGGTTRMLTLARQLSAAGRLRRMVHVSTAYVCGTHTGIFEERQLDTGQSFRNTYERSKAHAERILRWHAEDLPLIVARPSIIVGDSASGWTPSFNVVYWPLQAFSRGLLGEIPADPDGVLDIVPVDYAADAILALHEDDGATGTVHVVAGEHAVSNRSFLELACVRLQRPSPGFAPGGALPMREADLYLPYFDVQATFDDTRSRELLAPRGIECPPLESYFSTLVDYAEGVRWGKHCTTRESCRQQAGTRAA